MTKRDEFLVKTKRLLAERVAHFCSNPRCRKLTTGPHSDPNKSLTTGHAAHIHAAAPLGPRYDSNQTPEQRRDISNGIWACRECGVIIDTDHAAYTADTLRSWKANFEAIVEDVRLKGYAASLQLLNAHSQLPSFTHRITFDKARIANSKWLENVFANKARARQAFGQTLAPFAQFSYPVLARQDLVDAIAQSIVGANGQIVAVLGEEGTGKSWTLAKALRSGAGNALTVIVSAKEIPKQHTYPNQLGFFIDRLILQSGEEPTEALRTFWKTEIHSMKVEPGPPNFVVCVDGLNENAGVAWRQWVEGMASDLSEIGGVLVVTDRTKHFEENVKRSLHVGFKSIVIPRWSDSDLREIFVLRKVNYDAVQPTVRQTLQNPRILGIAFSLYSDAQIESFEELSVERLLFEYIRFADTEGRLGETRLEFARRLSHHAKEVLERATRQTRIDLKVFETTASASLSFNLSSDLAYASTGQFYRQLESPNLYELSEKGLDVALGISIVTELERAERNHHDVTEALNIFMEPIAALDKTAQVICAANIVACVEEKSDSVKSALIGHFLAMQNVSVDLYPAFSGAMRLAADAAMDLLKYIELGHRHVAKREWLIAGLRQQRNDPVCWAVISKHVDLWLRHYSLQPHLGVPDHALSEDQRQDRKSGTSPRLVKRQTALSAKEQAFLADKCILVQGFDPQILLEPAFMLLAGMPLAPFGDALATWSFTNALNGSMRGPMAQFENLFQYNQQDWDLANASLLKGTEQFFGPDASETAKWAVVRILSAIGTDQSEKGRESLLDSFKPDWRTELRHWRRIENYCATDPCDPDAVAPDNLDKARAEMGGLDFSETYRSRSRSTDDIKFEMATTGLARFDPDFFLAVQKRKIAAMLRLDGWAFTFAARDLVADSVTLDKDDVQSLLKTANELSILPSHESEHSSDRWSASQFAFMAAMPHLSGDQQIDALVNLPPHGALMTNYTGVFEAGPSEHLERALRKVIASGRADSLASLLCYISCTTVSLTSGVKGMIGAQLEHVEGTVRYLALKIMAERRDRELLQYVVAQNSAQAHAHSDTQKLEYAYASMAIIEAAELGLIEVADAFTKISLETLDYAQQALGEKARPFVIAALRSAVAKTFEAEFAYDPPRSEVNIDARNPNRISNRSLVDPDPAPTFAAMVARVNETQESFADRQRQAWEAYSEFASDISKQDAHLILENPGRQSLEAVDRAYPDISDAWAALVLDATGRRLSYIVNFGLSLAVVISERQPDTAVELFKHLGDTHGVLSLTYGRAKTPHAIQSLWASFDSVPMETLRAQVLDTCDCDAEIAANVSAGLANGKSANLIAYALERIGSEIASKQARGLTVLGYLDRSEQAEKIIGQFAGKMGMVGDSARAAKYAYDRNIWARHWFSLMSCADSVEPYWASSRLLLKIIDFRFAHWEDEYAPSGTLARRFGSTLSDKLEKRIEKRAEKRKKTLFGAPAPNRVYVLS